MKQTTVGIYITTALLLLAAIVVGGLIVGNVFSDNTNGDEAAINSFEECVEAGNPVMESYPPQCRTEDGRTFTQDIGNILEKQDLVVVDSPRPYDEVENTFTIEGRARGAWFFEATFPVKVLDGSAEQIGEGYAEAQSEWMTEDFVPFVANVSLDNDYEGLATIVLERANPSGLEENADEVRFPIEFVAGSGSTSEPVANGGCYVGGCSGQICSDDPEAVSTCEWREEYACYQGATCERQASGECGWTETPELLACLEASNSVQ